MSLSKLKIVIPTFYPGKIIKKCFDSLPLTSEIIVMDNGEDPELEKIIKIQKHKIKHYKVGDIGLSKSFNIALAKSKNESMLLTQPDVYFEKNAILNLIKAQKKYKNAGIISPLSFEKKKYSQYDYLDLSLSREGNLKNTKRPKKINIIPSGDICVEAVNATAMLIKKSIIADVRDYKRLKSELDKSKATIVFHLAAQPLVRLSYIHPKDTFDVNFTGTLNILHAIKNKQLLLL